MQDGRWQKVYEWKIMVYSSFLVVDFLVNHLSEVG